MEVSVCCETSILQLRCAHCGHREDDPFELLDGGCIQAVVCGSCGLTFHLAVMECLACGEEWQFGWRRPPTRLEFEQLTCGRCSTRYQDHEAHTLSNDLAA